MPIILNGTYTIQTLTWKTASKRATDYKIFIFKKCEGVNLLFETNISNMISYLCIHVSFFKKQIGWFYPAKLSVK